MVDVFCCPYDGLPCFRLVYVKGSDGKLRCICFRFGAKSSVSISEDWIRKELTRIRKELIPK